MFDIVCRNITTLSNITIVEGLARGHARKSDWSALHKSTYQQTMMHRDREKKKRKKWKENSSHLVSQANRFIAVQKIAY